MQRLIPTFLAVVAMTGCGKGDKANAAAQDSVPAPEVSGVVFDADSAYSYVSSQVAFGPRVPGSDAHQRAGAWLASELRRHGAVVTEQKGRLTCFDGESFDALNIFGQYNPDAQDRLLLLAHWDCRPWADQDPDPANHHRPVDGANDGASGVGVLLEIARQLSATDSGKGIDILFVDLEDRGTDGDEDSWALGARYFVENPPVAGYAPAQAILLDMVGGKDAIFCREYFSEQAAPQLASTIWGIAEASGYGSLFRNRMGGAVTDDHVQLIEHGIPAIDIIEYHPEAESGFNPRWHTLADNMEGIDPATLKAVGQTVVNYIYGQY